MSKLALHLGCACRETILGLSKLIELPSGLRILKAWESELEQAIETKIAESHKGAKALRKRWRNSCEPYYAACNRAY